MAGATIVHIPDRVGRSREHPEQKTTSDELYLYQLKNILLEIDDALDATMAKAVDLPLGVARKWPPTQVPESAYEADIQRRSLFRRVLGLRSPHKLKSAIRHRISPYRLEQLRRFRKRKDSVGLILALRASMPTQRLSRALELLAASEQAAKANVVLVEQLQSENAELRQHMDNVSAMQASQESRIAEALEQHDLAKKEVASERETATRHMQEASAHVSALQVEVKRLNREHKKTAARLEKELARAVKQTASERDTATKHIQEASAHVSALQVEVDRLKKAREQAVTALQERLAQAMEQAASEKAAASRNMDEASAHVSALQKGG